MTDRDLHPVPAVRELTHLFAGDLPRLHTLSYTPPPGVATCGTMLIRTPYDCTHLAGMATSLARHGFTVITQDVRGRYRSAGRWEPYRHEGHDGVRTLELLANHHLLSGPLFLLGSSYGAHAALETAGLLADHPRLAPAGVIAMVPALGLWDTAHDPDGTPRIFDRIGWWAQHGAGAVSSAPLDAATLNALTRRAEAHGPLALLDDPLFADNPQLAQGWRRLWEAPRPDPRTRWAHHRTPLLAVGGETDFFAADTRALVADWPVAASTIWGPWGHGLGTELPGDHPVRLALRRAGGLLTPLTTWCRSVASGGCHPIDWKLNTALARWDATPGPSARHPRLTPRKESA
ncbi:CocE/NonD family hydrolase [Rothia sp. LK2588]|uniref:CocE/NonD family hydrolase n=1 Tax=Rothia sp. LK2588 TaxID=3114369 RepID=UPI0034CEF9FB